MRSTAYIIASGVDYTYRFAGVIEVEYNFALNIDAKAEDGEDIIHGARKLPDQIRLSVVETDVESSPGYSASMLRAMDSIRKTRTLCKIVTNMGTWENMLLAEITATEDEVNQCGWAGDLVFMQYVEKTATDAESGGGGGSSSSSTRKTENNSSTRKNTGTKATTTTVTGAAFQQILARSGVSGKVMIN